MAETIASNAQALLVPVALCKLFSRAIQARRRVAAWFEARGAQKEKESNKRHHHFITILEDALQLLRPSISSGPQATRMGGERAASDTLPVENRFAGLSLEDAAELADEELGEMNLPVVTPVILNQDEAKMEEELRFAVGLLFDDLNAMRTVACDQWAKYKKKEMDLIVPAMTTDTAIKLAQKAEVEFDLVVPRPKKYPAETYPVWKLLDTIIKPTATEKSGTEIDTIKSGDPFWPIYLGLKQYLNRMLKWDPEKSLPAIIAKDFGDRKPNAYTLPAIESSQTVRIGIFGKNPEVRDMPSRTVEEMFVSKQLPIWMTYVVELQFLSQDILGDSLGHPYVELGYHLIRLIRQNNKLIKDWESMFLPHEVFDTCFYKLAQTLQNCQDWVLLDSYKKPWQELAGIKQIATHPILKQLLKPREDEGHHLGRYSVLCGMLNYETYLKYHSAGLILEHHSLAIVMLAYLYIAGRLERPDGIPNWPDMECVIYAEDPDWLFVGGRPGTVEEIKNKFLLASGSMATNRARDIPLHRLRVNVHKLRDFRDPMMFGAGIYLPSDRFGESDYNFNTAKIEDVFKRLVDTIKHTTNLGPDGKADGRPERMPDMYFTGHS